MREPLQKQVQVLWDYLAMQDTPEKADVILVLSGSTLSPARKGLALYEEEFAPYLVTNGTKGTFSNMQDKRADADIYGDYLVEHGVPKENVLREKISTNTLNAIQESIKLLKEKHIPHTKIILIARPLHQRRVFATATKQFPEYWYINMPGEENPPSSLHEVALRQVAVRCGQEYERLIHYAKQGDVAQQEFPDEVIKAYAEIKRILAL